MQDPFRSENFYYNEKEDYCVCPMGQHMNFIGQERRKTVSGYISVKHRYEAQNCNGCPLRPLCTKAVGNRIIERNHRLEKYRRKAFNLLTSDEGLKQRGRRCIEPEAVFGHIKFDMAYRRFRHFCPYPVKLDFAFFDIAFNLQKSIATITFGVLKPNLDPVSCTPRTLPPNREV